MSRREALVKLGNVLAELYPTPDTARSVCRQARLTLDQRLPSDPGESWKAILRAAEMQDRVWKVIVLARLEHASNEELHNAADTYFQDWRPARVDLAVITAMNEELDPLLSLIGGESHWARFQLEGFVHYFAEFDFAGLSLAVVACSQWQMGRPVATAVSRLKLLGPRLFVMTGICAGWKEKDVRLGDVIVAIRAFQAGEGKQTEDGFQADTQTFQPPPWLVGWLKDFAGDRQWIDEIATPRPLILQAAWVLCKLAEHPGFPTTDADREEITANRIDWERVRQSLQQQQYITANGHLAEAFQALHKTGKLLPKLARPAVFYGTFASREAVITTVDPFDKLAERVRTTRAIELEVATLFMAASEIGVPAFAVKGVSDYATPQKDDSFHEYAAEASARWMFAFLRKNASRLIDNLPQPRSKPPRRSQEAEILLDACEMQVKSSLAEARHKYLPELYVHRSSIEQEINAFFDSPLEHNAPNCHLIIARAGSGKTNLLCQLAEVRVKKQPVVLLMGGNISLDGSAGLLGVIQRQLQIASKWVHFQQPTDCLHALQQLAEELDQNSLILLDAINE